VFKSKVSFKVPTIKSQASLSRSTHNQVNWSQWFTSSKSSPTKGQVEVKLQYQTEKKSLYLWIQHGSRHHKFTFLCSLTV